MSLYQTVEVSRVSRRCHTPTRDTFSAGRRLLCPIFLGCHGCHGGFQKPSRDVRACACAPARIMVFSFCRDTRDTLWLLPPQALRVAKRCHTPNRDTPMTPVTPAGGEA
jgi:hypothetical protein